MCIPHCPAKLCLGQVAPPFHPTPPPQGSQGTTCPALPRTHLLTPSGPVLVLSHLLEPQADPAPSPKPHTQTDTLLRPGLRLWATWCLVFRRPGSLQVPPFGGRALLGACFPNGPTVSPECLERESRHHPGAFPFLCPQLCSFVAERGAQALGLSPRPGMGLPLVVFRGARQLGATLSSHKKRNGVNPTAVGIQNAPNTRLPPRNTKGVSPHSREGIVFLHTQKKSPHTAPASLC